ncbi:MAG: YSIRK Gram-positive signal peptide, partial [Actinomyces urogenitalis DORA_12]
HAYYEVTYKDGSTSGKIEAPDVIIKQVTETSVAPIIGKVQVTDGQIIVTFAKEVAQGTKFSFVKQFTDGEDRNFSQNGSCLVDKSNSEEMSQAVTVDGKKVTFPITDKVNDLKLGTEFGIVVKEPHKFRSCAKSEPVITTPDKVAVRDPHKLTDADRQAIDKAIRDANTVNDVSKLPDGTGFINDPAFIEFDKDGNVTIISPNDVETDWDNDGNPIYA